MKNKHLLILCLLLMNTSLTETSGQVLNKIQDRVFLNFKSSEGYKIISQKRDLNGKVWLIPSNNHPIPFDLSVSQTFSQTATARSQFYRIEEVDPVHRGELIKAELRETYSAFISNLLLIAEGIPMTLDYDVKCYRITYKTVNPWGKAVIASGSLFVPVGKLRAPLVMYQHGTILKKSDAPSNKLNFFDNISSDLAFDFSEALIGVLCSGKGFVTTLTDYVGMGSGEGFHPYVHARSEATAAVDLARAAKVFLDSSIIDNSGKTFVFGYSQGGQAAVALQREMQFYHSDEFNVKACAAGAGPYSMSKVMLDDLLSSRPHPNPFYFPYVLAGYNRVYGFDPSYQSIYKPEYIESIPRLVDGTIKGDEANKKLPSVFTEVLKEEFLNEIKTDPDHWVHQVLKNNDVTDWVPESPLRLYHGTQDKNVIIENAYFAKNAFIEQGASNVEIIEPIPNGNHYTSAIPFMTQAIEWFLSF